MVKKNILWISSLVIFAMLLCGCNKTHTYKVEQLCAVTVSGSNGDGVAQISGNSEFEDQIVADVLGKDADDVKTARLMIALEIIEYKTDSKIQELSNGDKIEIEMSCDAENEKILKEYGVKIGSSKFTYEVSGLVEPQNIDLFENISYEYDGISPKATISINTDKCSDIIKNNVYFSADNSNNIKNGDIITITATYNEDTLRSEGYKVEADTAQITVSGLDEYINDISNFAVDKIDEELRSSAESVISKSSYKVNDSVFSAKLIKEGNFTEEWTIDSVELEPVKIEFICFENSNEYNDYVIFWSTKIEATKSKTSKFVSNPDGYSVGDKETFEVYIETHYSNLASISGVLSTDYAKSGYTTYGTSLTANFVGASLDEVYQNFLNQYENYEVVNKIK